METSIESLICMVGCPRTGSQLPAVCGEGWWTTVYSSPRLSFGGDCDTLCSGHRAKQAMTLKAGNAVQVLGQADMIECL